MTNLKPATKYYYRYCSFLIALCGTPAPAHGETALALPWAGATSRPSFRRLFRTIPTWPSTFWPLAILALVRVNRLVCSIRVYMGQLNPLCLIGDCEGMPGWCETPSLGTTHGLETEVPNSDLVLHIGDISYAVGYAHRWDQVRRFCCFATFALTHAVFL